MDKDAYLLKAISAVDRSIPHARHRTAHAGVPAQLRLSDTWVQRVRHWYPEQVTAAQVRADPGGYILCMSFFDITELVDIDPASGVWIYLSSEPHNEEQQLELRRLQNWLERFHKTLWLPGPGLP